VIVAGRGQIVGKRYGYIVAIFLCALDPDIRHNLSVERFSFVALVSSLTHEVKDLQDRRPPRFFASTVSCLCIFNDN
jgi:hypothetical protein